jgi:hypothetical protein
MKKSDLIRNIGFTSVPLSLVIFGAGWLIFHHIIFAAILPVIFLFASIKSNIGKYKDDKKKEKAGFTKHTFSVRKAFDLAAPNDSIGPSLCLEVDDNKFVLLNGQWLYESEIYGEDAQKFHDRESHFFNCHLNPHSFPASEFELWISRLDDEPHRIIVKGAYIEPEKVTWQTPENFWHKNFAIIDKSEIET